MQEKIKYVMVWPGWLRLSHWILAFGLLFQLASAWAVKHDIANYSFWHDWHVMVGQMMMLALILRIILLFRPGIGHWRALLDYRSQLQPALQTLKFYLSFARAPLPNWYAHNPLWKPVYLLIYLLLAGIMLSGLLFDSASTLIKLRPDQWHAALASMIAVLTLFHIVTAFLHDWKSKGAVISGMINGHRYFHYPEKGLGIDISVPDKTVEVNLDSIKRESPPDDQR